MLFGHEATNKQQQQKQHEKGLSQKCSLLLLFASACNKDLICVQVIFNKSLYLFQITGTEFRCLVSEANASQNNG